MAFGLGFGIGFCRRFGAVAPDPGTIEGTPVSIAQGVDGETLADVVTWGSMTATVGTLGSPVREMRLNAGSWAIYVGTTALVHPDEWDVRESWESTSGATRTDTAGPMTVVGAPAPSTMPVVRSRIVTAPSGGTTSHPMANPSGATSGDLVIHIFGTDGNSGTLTESVGSGWTITAPTINNGADLVTMAIAWKVLDGTGDTLTITSAASEQSIKSSICFSAFSGTPIISSVSTPSGTVSPDGPSVSFGGTYACRVITAVVASQATGVQTAAPSGYADLQTGASGGAGSGSVRIATAEKEVTGTSEDPPTWGVSNVAPITVTIAVRG